MSFFEKFKIISSSIWVHILPFARELLKESGPVLMAAAMSAVQASRGGSTNLQKRQAAFDSIVSELTTQGIKLADRKINAAIEIALINSREQ